LVYLLANKYLSTFLRRSSAKPCDDKAISYFCGVISQSNSRQASILSAALRLFVGQGFHGTPTSKIAQEAGVANGTLFHYFPSKDELITTLYIDIKSRLTEFMVSRTESSGNLKDKLRAYYTSSLDWALHNKLEFRFIQQFHSSPYLAQVDPEKIREQTEVLHTLIQSGIELELIKPLPLALIFTLLSSHVFGMNQYLLSGSFPETDKEQVIRESFESMWDMIALKNG
jgi:AcrR family transcriptional regulator